MSDRPGHASDAGGLVPDGATDPTDASVDGTLDAADTDSNEAGSASDAAVEDAAGADGAVDGADGGAATLAFPVLRNGSFELTSGTPGMLAYQPPGSPPLGDKVIAPWTACVAGPAAEASYTANGSVISGTAGATFLRLPANPGNAVGVSQSLTSVLRAGVTYGFRIDLRSTASTASVRLQLYGVTVPCLTNSATVLALSEPVSNLDWQRVCVVFTPSIDTPGLMLVATADAARDAEQALLADDLRADPSCAP